MRVRSLAGRLLILQLTVVAVTVAAGALITVLVARERTETAARDRSLTVARTIAALPDVPDALRDSDPSATLQPLAERVRGVAHVDFVTIMRPDGIRYTHPTPSLIGRPFVGTFKPAASGQTVVETTSGTLGRSVRAVVPVRDNGRVVALVAVGVLTDAIGDEVAALLPGLLGLAAVILAHRRRCSASCSPAVSSARRSGSSRRRSRPSTPTTTRRCTRCARASWSSTTHGRPRAGQRPRDAAARGRPDDARARRAARRRPADRRRPRPARPPAAPSSATAAASAPS